MNYGIILDDLEAHVIKTFTIRRSPLACGIDIEGSRFAAL